MMTATAIARPYEQTWNREHAVHERELASRQFRSFSEAFAWLSRHLETWRDALEPHEAQVELWIHGRHGSVEMHTRHGRERDELVVVNEATVQAEEAWRRMG